MPTITPQWVPNTPTITVPINLRYDDANGDQVDKLYPREYLILVGQDLNAAMSDIVALEGCCSGTTAQIIALQAAVATIPPVYNTPTINSQCLSLSGTTAIDTLLEILVIDWCNFLGVTGSRAALATSITAQCNNLNSAPSFGTPGTSMSAITGWKNSPQTIADSFTNSWLTLCDARAGITSALAAVTPTCSQVIIDYAVFLNSWSAGFNIYFDGYSFIPTGFTDNGSIIKIEDAGGNIYQQSVNVVTQSTTPTALNINLSGTTLAVDSTYTVTLTSNVTNATIGLTCVKTTIKTVFSTPTTESTCCPDIGNYTAAMVSGSTSLVLVSGLSYTPRYIGWTPKNSYSAAFFYNPASGYPYITYTLGGGYLTFAASAIAGTVDLDYIAYR